VVAVVARKLMGRAVKVGEAEVADASGAVPLRLGRTRWNTMDSAGRSGRPTGIGLPSGDRFPPDAASSNRLGTASATVCIHPRPISRASVEVSGGRPEPAARRHPAVSLMGQSFRTGGPYRSPRPRCSRCPRFY